MLIAGKPVNIDNFDSLINKLEALPGSIAVRAGTVSASENTQDQFEGAAKKPKKTNPEDAYRIEQGEAGFSDNAPVGTDHFYDCVGLIIRDPVTHKTAVAHIDRYTDEKSLERIFERMPAGQLDAVLLGARFGPGSTKEQSAKNDSQENVQKVLRFLAGKNVNIVASRIYDEDQPDAVVVNPETFEITPAEPKKDNPDIDLVYPKLSLTGTGQQLRVAYDLTQSDKHLPMLLNGTEVKALNEMGKTKEDISNWYQNVRGFNPGASDYFSGKTPELQAAYEHSVSRLETAIDEAAVKNNAAPDARQRQAITDTLRTLPLYVGENADLANQALADFIEQGLFKKGSDGSVEIDMAGLKNPPDNSGQIPAPAAKTPPVLNLS